VACFFYGPQCIYGITMLFKQSIINIYPNSSSVARSRGLSPCTSRKAGKTVTEWMWRRLWLAWDPSALKWSIACLRSSPRIVPSNLYNPHTRDMLQYRATQLWQTDVPFVRLSSVPVLRALDAFTASIITHSSYTREITSCPSVSFLIKVRRFHLIGTCRLEWQWHQLGHMQIRTSPQTHNHASISPLSFLQARCPSCYPTNSVKADRQTTSYEIFLHHWSWNITN